MRMLFFLLILVHGMIHVLGFVKGFGFKEVKGLTMPITKSKGLLWLLAALLILVFAWLYGANAKFAWIVGFVAMGLSQVLVFVYWRDAKFGTLPNVAILLVSITMAASYWFQARIAQETLQLTNHHQPLETSYVTEEAIGHLPESVQRWLRHSGMLGKPFIHLGKVTQRANMKLKPKQNAWMSAHAVQFTTADPPSFIWSVDVRMNSLLGFQGRDKFEDGKGEMLIKVNSLLNVVKEAGEKLDEGTLQRYLGEVAWFPSMALSPYITWEALSDSSVRATMEYKGTRGSGVFHFSPEGDLVLFSAMRFRGNESDAGRREWILQVEDHKVFEGIRVPYKMTATWGLETGEWTWLKLEIVDLTYNQPFTP